MALINVINMFLVLSFGNLYNPKNPLRVFTGLWELYFFPVKSDAEPEVFHNNDEANDYDYPEVACPG